MSELRLIKIIKQKKQGCLILSIFLWDSPKLFVANSNKREIRYRVGNEGKSEWIRVPGNLSVTLERIPCMSFFHSSAQYDEPEHYSYEKIKGLFFIYIIQFRECIGHSSGSHLVQRKAE